MESLPELDESKLSTLDADSVVLAFLSESDCEKDLNEECTLVAPPQQRKRSQQKPLSKSSGKFKARLNMQQVKTLNCLLYTSPSPRDS